jgi:hypothetical protein
MIDNKAIDSIIKVLGVGGVTIDDLRSAPLGQVVNLCNLLSHLHQLADAEVQDRVERMRPGKGGRIPYAKRLRGEASRWA